MKLSAKSRYGLAAMVLLSKHYELDKNSTLVSISENLGISKIYLEQVFSLLKRDGLVVSVKGSQGGYKLSRSPDVITAFDVLSAIDSSLFEKTETTLSRGAMDIESAMQHSTFRVLDIAIKDTLQNITLQTILDEAKQHASQDGYMFFI